MASQYFRLKWCQHTLCWKLEFFIVCVQTLQFWRIAGLLITYCDVSIQCNALIKCLYNVLLILYIYYNIIHLTPLQADKWKEKFCATSQELKFLQVRILVKIKAVSFL